MAYRVRCRQGVLRVPHEAIELFGSHDTYCDWVASYWRYATITHDSLRAACDSRSSRISASSCVDVSRTYS
jgi:hypothetical protein